MSSGSDATNADPQRWRVARTLLSSALIAAGVMLLVLSSAFLLGKGPASSGGPPSANAEAVEGELSEETSPSAVPTAATTIVAPVSPVVRAPTLAPSPVPPTVAPPTPLPAPPVVGEPAAAGTVLAAPMPTVAAPSPVPPAPIAAPPVVPTVPPPATPTPLPPPPPPPPAPAPAVALSTFEADILAGVNAQRVAAGLPALQLDASLVMVARERSNDMVAKGYFAHVSPTGETAFSLMDKYGIPYAWAGENLARNNYPDSQAVAIAMEDWIASQGHRDNMLTPHYSLVGIGAAVDAAGMKYFTVVFVGFQ